MSRSLTGAVNTAIGNAITQPGYLVQIGFSVALRLSSRGDVVWQGNTWLDWDIEVGGIDVDGTSSEQSGSLTLGNTDNVIGALLLVEGIAEKEVNIWKLYGDAPAASDPVLMFSGVGDGYSLLPDAGKATITLEQQAAQTLYTPRRYITRSAGFSALPPVGTAIMWNGERFFLQRRLGSR